MATPPLDEFRIRQAVDAFAKFGTYSAAARHLGLARSSLMNRLERAATLEDDDPEEYEAPSLPSADEAIDDIIAHRKQRFLDQQAAARASAWAEYRVKVDGPFGIVIVGDPHLDDNGCNWPALERHIGLLERTPALFGIAGGDYTNNWAGRLQRLYSDAEVTRKDAFKLAEWFFGRRKRSGQSIWWTLIKGNHDMWSGSADPLDWMARGAANLQDWRAQLYAVASNGVRVGFDVSHNHKGSSIWNPLHGPMREAQLHGRAHVYVSGHQHHWACFEGEHDKHPGHVYWACRARGYKHLDSHALTGGFSDQQYGASITAIVDPDASGPRQVRCFPDVDEAVDFLAFKRRRI